MIIKDTEDLERAARQFIFMLPKNARVIAFDGPMGAGKTTFISAIARLLGSIDEANSPTFSLVNEYAIPGGSPFGDRIYHFDFYRIESVEEALDIGAEDYFYSGCLCLLEWADKVEDILPDSALRVSIAPRADGTRLVTFQKPKDS